MLPNELADAMLAWLLTYALHSSVLLGIVAVLTHSRVRAESWRDALWKAALIGGIVTASVQQLTLTRLEPLAGVVSLTDAALTQRVEPRILKKPSPTRQAEETSVAREIRSLHLANETEPTRAWQPTRPQLFVGAWLLIALVLLARLAIYHVRLFRALRGRVELTDVDAVATLAELRRRADVQWPVRLSVASCPTPIALGAAEICVPQRFLRELDADAQRCALAHELAHLARRDPLWHLLAGVIECVFFFQPLNRFARVRLRDAAEHLADDWAVRQTGSALGLARCLSEVATWVDTRAWVPTGTMAMAEAGSPLIRRIERLLLATLTRPEPSLARRLCVALMVIVLGGFTMPVFTARALPSRTPANNVTRDATSDSSNSLAGGTVNTSSSEELPARAQPAQTIEDGVAANPDVPQLGSVAVPVDDIREQEVGTWHEERIPLTALVRARAAENARAHAADPFVQVLTTAMQQPPKHEADLVAERAMWALALMQNGDVLAPLALATNSNDWRVRAYASWNLGMLAPHQARELLTRLGADDHWRVRMTSAYGLGATKDVRAIAPLEDLLGDKHWQVRIAGIENLDAIGDSRAVPALSQLLDDPNAFVRDAARAAVARLGAR